MDEFEQQFQTTGKLKKEIESWKKIKKEEAANIEEMNKRFKKLI